MSIKLYGLVGSTATFRAMAALYEKDLDFEFVPIDLASKEQKTPQFLTRNPFGQVPDFQCMRMVISPYSSRAITKYIAEAYADKGTPLKSKDPKKSAIEAVWSEVEAQKFDPTTSKLGMDLVLKPKWGQTTDEAIVSEFEKQLEDLLDVYESRLTKSKYLGGDCFTLVDLHHLPNVYYLMMTKSKRLFDTRPYVSAWVLDIVSRPAWIKVASKLEGR